MELVGWVGAEPEQRFVPSGAAVCNFNVATKRWTGRSDDDLRILMLLPQLEEFAQAIQEHRQPAVTVTDGRRVLKVLDAIIKSDRTGEPVRIG